MSTKRLRPDTPRDNDLVKDLTEQWGEDKLAIAQAMLNSGYTWPVNTGGSVVDAGNLIEGGPNLATGFNADGTPIYNKFAGGNARFVYENDSDISYIAPITRVHIAKDTRRTYVTTASANTDNKVPQFSAWGIAGYSYVTSSQALPAHGAGKSAVSVPWKTGDSKMVLSMGSQAIAGTPGAGATSKVSYGLMTDADVTSALTYGGIPFVTATVWCTSNSNSGASYRCSIDTVGSSTFSLTVAYTGGGSEPSAEGVIFWRSIGTVSTQTVSRYTL